MFGSSNSYYTTTRFPAANSRPMSSKRNVMTKQHLNSIHSQVLPPPQSVTF
jgi:hypothetical protein